MIDALMLGIRYCCKRCSRCEKSRMEQAGFTLTNSNLKAAFSKNISILESYGVCMCAANELNNTVESVIFSGKVAKNESTYTILLLLELIITLLPEKILLLI